MPLLMLIAVVAASAVILSHLAVVLWFSWTNGSPGDPDLTYTAQNFVEVFSDPRTFTVLIDTIEFSCISLAVALAFGIPAAWLAERTDFPAKTLLFTLMAVGLLIPGFAAAMGWLFLLHPRIGLVNQLLVSSFHLAGPPLNISTIAGMGWVQGLNLAPLAFIMTAAVFRAMDPTLEEAARMHGAGPFTVLRRITVRLAWPGILAAAIYIFMTAFAAFDVPAIIGWGNRIFTFTTYLYLLLNPQDLLPRYGLGAALSTVAMAIAALMSWWYGAMARRSRRFAVVSGRAYRPRIVRLGRCRFAAWGFVGVYFVLGKVLPIALLAWSSLLPFFQLPSARALATVSLAHYFSLPWELVLTGLWNTSILAVLAPSLTLGLALAFSWVVLRSRFPGRAGFDFIAFLPHAVPSIVFGVGALLLTLFVIQRTLPIYGTIWLSADRVHDRALELRHPHDQQRPHPDPSGARGIGADERRHRVRGVRPHIAAAARPHPPLCLAVDRALDLSRAHLGGHPVDRRQPDLSGGGVEFLARRRARPGLRARRGDAGDDDADDRDLLAAGAPSGTAGDLRCDRNAESVQARRDFGNSGFGTFLVVNRSGRTRHPDRADDLVTCLDRHAAADHQHVFQKHQMRIGLAAAGVHRFR